MFTVQCAHTRMLAWNPTVTCPGHKGADLSILPPPRSSSPLPLPLLTIPLLPLLFWKPPLVVAAACLLAVGAPLQAHAMFTDLCEVLSSDDGSEAAAVWAHCNALFLSRAVPPAVVSNDWGGGGRLGSGATHARLPG